MAEDGSDSERSWKFSVDEVGPDADDVKGDGDTANSVDSDEVPDALIDEEDDDESDGNVAGSLRAIGPIEPETPSLENAFFVVLGVYIGVLGVIAIFVPTFEFTLQRFLIITGAVLALGLVSFGFFGLLTPDT